MRIVSIIFILFLFVCCENQKEEQKSASTKARKVYHESDSALLIYTIEIVLDPKIYRKTLFGEPPQIAVWLENRVTGQKKTVFVTWRMASGNFIGKIECLSCLPAWLNTYKSTSGNSDPPNRNTPNLEGITGATPKESATIKTGIDSPEDWMYFVEINASGDFNDHYGKTDSNGIPDDDGTGQPALVYIGQFNSAGKSDTARLAGYSSPDGRILSKSMDKISTAKDLVRWIRVTLATDTTGAYKFN